MKASACTHPKFYLGCRTGKSTRFAVLDIDQDSLYHDKQSLTKILNALSASGIKNSTLYRSSYSGGWHLYLFFDEPVNCSDLRTQLFKLLTLNDFRVKKGDLEIFPNPGHQDSLGLGFRLPLQQGFAWLDKRTLDVDYERHELSATKALELFIDVLESDSNSYSDFQQLKAQVEILSSQKQKAQRLGANLTDTSNIVPIRTSRNVDRPSVYKDIVKSIFAAWNYRRQLVPGKALPPKRTDRTFSKSRVNRMFRSLSLLW